MLKMLGYLGIIIEQLEQKKCAELFWNYVILQTLDQEHVQNQSHLEQGTAGDLHFGSNMWIRGYNELLNICMKIIGFPRGSQPSPNFIYFRGVGDVRDPQNNLIPCNWGAGRCGYHGTTQGPVPKSSISQSFERSRTSQKHQKTIQTVDSFWTC